MEALLAEGAHGAMPRTHPQTSGPEGTPARRPRSGAATVSERAVAEAARARLKVWPRRGTAGLFFFKAHTNETIGELERTAPAEAAPSNYPNEPPSQATK